MSDFQRFIGVWELERVEDFLEGKREPAPGFERPVGLLIYLGSGEMSVNFSGTARIPFQREFFPSPSELASAGAAYGGYAGRWELDEVEREVVHLPVVSFVPNRVGARIRRSYAFAENHSLLLLKPIALSPSEASPRRVLAWRRRRAEPTP